MVDPEAYFSRKKCYGFNLQAICDWNGRFIWVSMGHTASVHDSTAFKSSQLYQQIHTFFDPEEYVLADKAYALERHVITPYKEPASRERANAAFNFQLSGPRVKIEHAFGVLKARWPTLYNIPIRIDNDKERGHRRVIEWTTACIVLHNILNAIHDDNSWLQAEIIQDLVEQAEQNNAEREEPILAKRAGVRRREGLRDLVELL